jgi:hypothetical protein
MLRPKTNESESRVYAKLALGKRRIATVAAAIVTGDSFGAAMPRPPAKNECKSKNRVTRHGSRGR